jgi:hypothetical protein
MTDETLEAEIDRVGREKVELSLEQNGYTLASASDHLKRIAVHHLRGETICEGTP